MAPRNLLRGAPTRSPVLAWVSRVYTDHGIFHVDADGVYVTSTVGITFDELQKRIATPLIPR